MRVVGFNLFFDSDLESRWNQVDWVSFYVYHLSISSFVKT